NSNSPLHPPEGRFRRETRPDRKSCMGSVAAMPYRKFTRKCLQSASVGAMVAGRRRGASVYAMTRLFCRLVLAALVFFAVAKAQTLDVEMYDPTWFVDFSFAEKEPVKLVGAPADCKISFAKPGEAGTAAAPKSQPGEAFFNNLDPSANYGSQFANKIAVKCP